MDYSAAVIRFMFSETTNFLKKNLLFWHNNTNNKRQFWQAGPGRDASEESSKAQTRQAIPMNRFAHK